MLTPEVVTEIKITILLLILILGFGSQFVWADEDSDFNPGSYVFYLYFDNGQLFADRDFELKYDVIPEKFVPETYAIQFPFKGEIINLKNVVASEFFFDPKRGNIKFTKGKISVKAPYAPDGQKAVFYDSQGRQILNIFVSDSSFCNDDGVCNAERGEDNSTCSNDCKSLPSSSITPVESPGESTSGVSKLLIYLIIGIAVIGGWFGWKWWKRRQGVKAQFSSQNLNV